MIKKTAGHAKGTITPGPGRISSVPWESKYTKNHRVSGRKSTTRTYFGLSGAEQ